MDTVITCQACHREGRTTLGTYADHIKPIAKGGTGERTNYQLLCKPCHDAKSLADKGVSATVLIKGVDRSGRPTSPDHPWNRRP